MRIYVECYPDKVLVDVIAERLRFSKKNIDHRSGKARICKILEKYDNCIALLDEDPYSSQPPYLKRILAKSDSKVLDKYGIKVVIDANKNNRIVLLCPRLEEWIIKSTKFVFVILTFQMMMTDSKSIILWISHQNMVMHCKLDLIQNKKLYYLTSLGEGINRP